MVSIEWASLKCAVKSGLVKSGLVKVGLVKVVTTLVCVLLTRWVADADEGVVRVYDLVNDRRMANRRDEDR